METWPTIAALPQPTQFRAESALHGASGPVSGLYCLWGVDSALVYVGQSTHLQRRLSEHREDARKPFLYATWYPVADWHTRLQLEGILILAALPTHNRLLYLGISPSGVYEVGYRTPVPKEGRAPKAKTRTSSLSSSEESLGKRPKRYRKTSP